MFHANEHGQTAMLVAEFKPQFIGGYLRFESNIVCMSGQMQMFRSSRKVCVAFGYSEQLTAFALAGGSWLQPYRKILLYWSY